MEGEPRVSGGLSGPQMTATGIGATESSCQDRNTVAKQWGERGNPVAFLRLLYAARCAAEDGNEGKATGKEGGKEGSVEEELDSDRERELGEIE